MARSLVLLLAQGLEIASTALYDGQVVVQVVTTATCSSCPWVTATLAEQTVVRLRERQGQSRHG
jgi:hypothetical protein